MLFYGANDSSVNQRIGLAISDSIDGPYRKVGINGMLLLDFPMNEKGPLSHPAIIQDETSGKWYLFACAGTVTNGHNAQEIIGYTSPDLIAWAPISTESTLVPSTTNYVYINLAGQIIHAADLPYGLDRTTFPERMGYLRLADLTVNASREVTAMTKYRKYTSVYTAVAHEALTNLRNTSYADEPDNLGSNVQMDSLKTGEGVLCIQLLAHLYQPSGDTVYARLSSGGYVLDGTEVVSTADGWNNKGSAWVSVDDLPGIRFTRIQSYDINGSTYQLGRAAVFTLALEW